MTVDIRTGRPFPRGARRSPMHKTLAAERCGVTSYPAQYGFLPTQTDMWDNDRDGDCVTAQEAWAKGWWSVRCGLPDLFIPTQEVVRWASKYGYLNGANLTDVMDTMAKDGFTVNGQNYKDGPYKSVDYTSWDALASSMLVGCTNIAIDADALPSGAGNKTGWYALSRGRFPNTDHCVGLGAYGSASYCYDLMKVSLPSAVGSSVLGCVLYTWNTHGFVTLDWLLGTCEEAWVRDPTTPGQSPAPDPTPGPTPGPTPTPTPGYVTIAYQGQTLSIPAGTTLMPPYGGGGLVMPFTLLGKDANGAQISATLSEQNGGTGPGDWLALIQAVIELLSGNPQGWPDLIRAILALFKLGSGERALDLSAAFLRGAGIEPNPQFVEDLQRQLAAEYGDQAGARAASWFGRK